MRWVSDGDTVAREGDWWLKLKHGARNAGCGLVTTECTDVGEQDDEGNRLNLRG